MADDDEITVEELLGQKELLSAGRRRKDKYYIEWKLPDGAIVKATGKRVSDVGDKIHLHTKEGHYIIPKKAITVKRGL